MARRAALLLVALLLGSCATDTPKTASQDDATCLGFGAVAGSDTYARCRLTLAHDRSVQRSARLNAIGNVLAGAGGAMDQSTPVAARSSASMTCMKSGEQTSGMNKLCAYNCLGSTVVENFGVAELCPLTIDH